MLDLIKKEKKNKIDVLITECKVFFAFSNEQFESNIKKLEGQKIVSLGAGGFIPKNEYQKFSETLKEINIWFKEQIKQNKLKNKLILDELINQESFYYSDNETFKSIALNLNCTVKQVLRVYKRNYKKYEQN
jgi:hypothetical protein